MPLACGTQSAHISLVDRRLFPSPSFHFSPSIKDRRCTLSIEHGLDTGAHHISTISAWEAEQRGFIVAATTNKTEQILGDFFKYGNGGTDMEALAHLHKNQIYQIADYLNIIPEIKERTPSPDTFSLPVSDQEFYFRIPFEKIDICSMPGNTRYLRKKQEKC